MDLSPADALKATEFNNRIQKFIFQHKQAIRIGKWSQLIKQEKLVEKRATVQNYLLDVLAKKNRPKQTYDLCGIQGKKRVLDVLDVLDGSQIKSETYEERAGIK